MSYFIDNQIQYRRGDMYYVINNGYNGTDNKQGRPAIIVSNDVGNKHSSMVEVVYLTSQEKRPMPTHVSLICRIPSVALCENIQTISKDRLGEFIRCLSDEEMRRIDQALFCSLGLALPAKPIVPQKDRSEIEVERDLYKELYQQILHEVTQRR